MFLKNSIYDEVASYTQALFYRNVFATFSILAPFIFFFNINRPKKGKAEATLLHISALEEFINMAFICFLLVPVYVAIVYGLSHNLFAAIYPQYLYHLKLVDLQYRFLGMLFTPTLILFMQAAFFLNLLYGKRKVRKIMITIGVAVFSCLPLVKYTDILSRGFPYSLLVLKVFSVYHFVTLLYVLPVFLFFSSYFLWKNKEYPSRINFVTGVQAENA